MTQYRKKPVVIEAVQWLPEDPRHVNPAWLSAAQDIPWPKNGAVRSNNLLLQIMTLEGTMTVNVGDYIIQGVKGELYPCKPDIFELTYERVENE